MRRFDPLLTLEFSFGGDRRAFGAGRFRDCQEPVPNGRRGSNMRCPSEVDPK
jgi:hypothetical protein